jgi:exosortase F-associated protein
MRQHNVLGRLLLVIFALLVFIAVYVFQRSSFLDISQIIPKAHPNLVFAVNRICRLILNDIACFMLIHAIFQDRKYLKMAFWVFLIELLVILPLYLLVKLSLEGDSEISSPLLSQIHRLIVNPILMILLIAGFLHQKFKTRSNT